MTSPAPQATSCLAAASRSRRPVSISASAASVLKKFIQGRKRSFSCQSCSAMGPPSLCRKKPWASAESSPRLCSSSNSSSGKSPYSSPARWQSFQEIAGSSAGKMGSDWAAQPDLRRSRSGVKYSLRISVVFADGRRALSSSGIWNTSRMSRSSGAIFTAAKTLAPMARAAGVQKVTAPPALRSSAPV